jgi:hypothetical protein
MITVCFTETSVYSYKSTRCYNGEDKYLRLHRRENLRSYTLNCIQFFSFKGHFTEVTKWGVIFFSPSTDFDGAWRTPLHWPSYPNTDLLGSN